MSEEGREEPAEVERVTAFEVEQLWSDLQVLFRAVDQGDRHARTIWEAIRSDAARAGGWLMRLPEDVCLCGHAREEHHDEAAECEFFGSNEEGGADEHGWPHCGRFVDLRSDYHAIDDWWRDRLVSFYREAYERLRAAAEGTLAAAPYIGAELKRVLGEIDAAKERRSEERRASAERRLKGIGQG